MKPILLTLLACFIAFLSCNMNEKTAGEQSNQEAIHVGMDVSHHQGRINWKDVSASGKVSFVYIKATEGATYTDATFRYNIKNAQENGVLVGAYHYFRMTSSPEEQFGNFKKALSVIDCDLIPMVDVETSDGHTKAEVQSNLKKLLNLLEKEYGKKPMLYGTNSSYNSFCAPDLNDYPSYIGRYSNNPPVIKGKGEYTIWQYTESGKIMGIDKPVDLCKFNEKASIKDILL